MLRPIERSLGDCENRLHEARLGIDRIWRRLRDNTIAWQIVPRNWQNPELSKFAANVAAESIGESWPVSARSE
jgi:hypothetical protein